MGGPDPSAVGTPARGRRSARVQHINPGAHRRHGRDGGTPSIRALRPDMIGIIPPPPAAIGPASRMSRGEPHALRIAPWAATLAATLALVALAATAPTALGQAGAATRKAATAPARPARHARREDQGAQGVQGRAALHRPPRDPGLVGQPGGRPQGPADRLRPVRQALPGHPAGRSARRPSEIKVEPIPVEIGEAQGLLWAFDSLYVVVNAGGKYQSGLYRVRDTDGDDVLDKVELLRKLDGNGEHGPHAVVLGARRQVALRRRRQRDQAPRAGRLARPEGLGRGQPPAPDGRRPRLHDRREGPRRLRLPGRPRRQGLGAGLDGLPQRLRHRLQPRRATCSRTTPTWSGT